MDKDMSISPPPPRSPRSLLPPPPPAGIFSARPNGAVAREILPDPGVVIDPRSPYAVWGRAQYLTRMPYVPDAENPDCNGLKTVRSRLASFILCCS